jgi:cytochrome c oxidase subunit IV
MAQSHTRSYLGTFAALLILLVLTVAAALLEAGRGAAPIALTIATAKAVVIALYFMHLRDETPLVRVFAVAGFLWLGLLLLLMFSDYITRTEVIPARAQAGPGGSLLVEYCWTPLPFSGDSARWVQDCPVRPRPRVDGRKSHFVSARPTYELAAQRPTALPGWPPAAI